MPKPWEHPDEDVQRARRRTYIVDLVILIVVPLLAIVYLWRERWVALAMGVICFAIFFRDLRSNLRAWKQSRGEKAPE